MIIGCDELNRGIELLLSIPKSFYVSWRLTSFRDAFRLPILCRYNVKIIRLKVENWGAKRVLDLTGQDSTMYFTSGQW